jgi:hypothetical protein
MTVEDGPVGRFAVIGAVRHDGVDGPRSLVQQRADLAGIALATGRQGGGDDGVVAASTVRWSLRQVRRPRTLCLSRCHSPAP